jgi:VRR-NUC domain
MARSIWRGHAIDSQALPESVASKTSLESQNRMSWPALHRTKVSRKPRGHQEDDLQQRIVQYVGYGMRYNGRPLTDWLHSIPNGGQRNPREAARLKAQGVRAGVPDLCLPIAAAPYGGLYIELKVGKNTLTDAQLDFHQRLREGGQCVATCLTYEKALQVIGDYLLKAPGKFEHRAVSNGNACQSALSAVSSGGLEG